MGVGGIFGLTSIQAVPRGKKKRRKEEKNSGKSEIFVGVGVVVIVGIGIGGLGTDLATRLPCYLTLSEVQCPRLWNL